MSYRLAEAYVQPVQGHNHPSGFSPCTIRTCRVAPDRRLNSLVHLGQGYRLLGAMPCGQKRGFADQFVPLPGWRSLLSFSPRSAGLLWCLAERLAVSRGWDEIPRGAAVPPAVPPAESPPSAAWSRAGPTLSAYYFPPDASPLPSFASSSSPTPPPSSVTLGMT